MRDYTQKLPMGRAPHATSIASDGYYGGLFGGQEQFYFSQRRGLEGIDAVGLFLRALKYRWLAAAVIAAGLLLATLVTFMQTPKYQAAAKLEVVLPSARVIEDIEVTTESSDMRAFQTAREKLLSRALAQRVVFALNLTQRPDFLFPRRNFSLANLFARALQGDHSSSRPDLPQDALVRIAVARVMSNLQVNLVPNTSLLTIIYRDQNPQYAREIANQVAQSFIDQRIDQSSKTSMQAGEFIREQVRQVKEKLQDSEKALVEYAKNAGITVTGNDLSLIGSNMAEINKALSSAIQENLDYERLVKQIDAGQGGSLEQVMQSEALEKLRGRLAELKGDYREKQYLFKPDFPEMRQLQSQIQEMEKQLNLGIDAITGAIRLKQQETIAKVADLRRKLTELEADQSAYQDKNIQYTILKREVDSNRTQYDSLIGKLNEVAVGSELKMQNAAIVDLAVAPVEPYSPKLPINLAVGLLLSLGLTAALIYILELVNNTFSNPEQVEGELGLPVLGILPLVHADQLEQQLTNPKSGLSESYRSLRTSLQFAAPDGAPRTLLVTSAEPSEGKSTTVVKLARDFASLGLKVLIVDADMRKPSIHRKFNEDNAIGLSNILMNSVRREDVSGLVRRQKDSNVFLMSAGTVPPNPADLLSSARMGLIVSSLKKYYDIVIIDAPPVIGLADVPILSQLADGTLLIVSSNGVSRKSASVSLRRLQSVGANVVGVAMTMFQTQKFDYGYSYARHYHYDHADLSPRLAEAEGEGIAHVSKWTFDSVAHGARGRFVGWHHRVKSAFRDTISRAFS